MADSFGSNSGGFGSSAYHPPAKPTVAPTHAHGHGLLKNLLDDAVTTAKGLPMGLVQTVEHPIRSIHGIEQSYANYYGHGFGHFYHEFKAHPLQPLLDAISVPLVLAGGAGFALKGADVAANIGRDAEISAAMKAASDLTKEGRFTQADALRVEQARQGASKFPALAKQADRFRKGTSATSRWLDTGAGFELPKAYSSNLWRRAMEKGTGAVLEGMLGKQIDYFSKANSGVKLLEQETSRRTAATASEGAGQVRAILAAKKAGEAAVTPQEIGRRIRDQFTKNAVATGHKIALKDAVHLDSNNRLKRGWTYIAEDPGVPGAPGSHLGMPNVKETIPREADIPATEGGILKNPKHLDLANFDNSSIEHYIKNIGGHFSYTNDPARAWVDHNGNVTLMRRGLVDQQVKDLSGAMALMGKIYRAPLTVWKAMILGQSPRYLVNNVIGNAGMYAAATNPRELTAGVLHAIKSVHGVHAEARAAKQMGSTLDGIMAKFMPNEFVHRQFGFMHHGALGLGTAIEGRLAKPTSRYATSGLRPLTEKIAYRGPQRASIMGAVTTLPGFRAIYRTAKRQGMDDYTAFQHAATQLMRDPAAHAAVEKRVADWAGQYYHLNDLEKGVTALVPFYNWTRHALRFGKEQVLSRPVQSSIMSQLGAMGDKQATKEMGHVPDFLKGAIPVGGHSGGILGFLLGQSAAGRDKVLLTTGYNPIAAAADDAQAIAALGGGGHAREAIGGQLNPVISGIVAGVTGQKLFSGAKANYSSPISGAINETFGGLPQVKVLKELSAAHGLGKPTSKKTKRGEPTLYTKDLRQQVSSLLGLNERDFSPKTAQKLYNTEQGIKKGRRHARKVAQSFSGKSSNF